MAASNTLEVILKLKDQITAPFRKLAQEIGVFAKNIRNRIESITTSIFSVKNALMGVAAFAVAKFTTGMVKSVADLGNQFIHLHEITGITVERLSELRYVAEQSGVDFAGLVKYLKKGQENMAEFAATGGKVSDIFQKMGPEFIEAARSGKPLEELLPAIARGLDKLTPGEKLSAIGDIFGKNSEEMFLVLRKSSKEIERLTLESHELGVVWTELEAEQGEGFIQSLNRLFKAIEGVTHSIIKALIPDITKLFDTLTEKLKSNGPEILLFGATFVDMAENVGKAILLVAKNVGGAVMTMLRPVLQLKKYIDDGEIERLKAKIESLKTAYLAKNPLTGEYGYNDDVRQTIYRELQANSTLLSKVEAQGREWNMLLSGELFGSPTGLMTGGAGDSMRELAARMAVVRQVAAAEGTKSGAPSVGGSVDELQGGMKGLKAGLEELKKSWGDTFAMMKQSVVAVGNAIVDSIVSGLEAAMDKTKTWGEALKDMATSILKAIRHELLDMIVKTALIKGVVGGLGGLLGGSYYEGYGFMAKGGIADPSLPRAARGVAHTSGPTIAGEAGTEAVIPLPDGRTVPVTMTGGGQINQYFFIQAIDTKDFNDRFIGSVSRNRDTIAAVAANGYQGRPALRRKYA